MFIAKKEQFHDQMEQRCVQFENNRFWSKEIFSGNETIGIHIVEVVPGFENLRRSIDQKKLLSRRSWSIDDYDDHQLMKYTKFLMIKIDWWSPIDDKTKLLMIMICYLFLLFPALGHQNRHNLRFLFFWGFFLRLCFLPTLLCHPPPLRKVDSRKKSKTTTSPRKENVQLSPDWCCLPTA